MSDPKNCANSSSTPQTKPIAWQQFAAALANGFQPPTGPGRCRVCGFHVPTQQHRAGCPKAVARPIRNVGHGQKVHKHPKVTNHSGKPADAGTPRS